jgi:hypothetical protein
MRASATRTQCYIQLKAFGQDVADIYDLREITPSIIERHRGLRFRFIDVSGGNGLFADFLLGRFPLRELLVWLGVFYLACPG